MCKALKKKKMFFFIKRIESSTLLLFLDFTLNTLWFIKKSSFLLQKVCHVLSCRLCTNCHIECDMNGTVNCFVLFFFCFLFVFVLFFFFFFFLWDCKLNQCLTSLLYVINLCETFYFLMFIIPFKHSNRGAIFWYT